MLSDVNMRSDDQAEAEAILHKPLSSDHPDLICTRVVIEQEHPVSNPLPPERVRTKEDPPGPPTIQDPAPPPTPGKVWYRLIFEKN